MANERYARYGAASGILAVVLMLIGYGLTAQDIPDLDAAASDWLAYVGANQGQIQLGTTIVAVGLFFFIWFLGSLRSALSVAEAGAGRLTSIAFGGGLLGAGCLLLGLTAFQAAAFRTDASADTVRGLYDLGTVAGAPAAAALTALFGATAIVGYRHRPFPAPVAGFAALAAITQPLALGAGVTDSGAFSGEGVLGLWIPVVTFAVALLALSGSLVRRTGGPAADAQ